MKIKASILLRIGLLFLLALVIAYVCSYQFSYSNMLDRATLPGDEVARAVATGAVAAIGSEDSLQSLYEDEKYREQMHQVFRFLCRESNIRYLYLYTIGEDHYRHYIICAANSDEDDLRMQTEYGFGSVRKIPLFQAEKNVMSGSVTEDYELIDNDYGYVCMHILPMRNEKGEIIALIGADYNMALIERMAKNSLLNALLLGLFVFGIAFVIALLLIKWSVIRPIHSLSGRMRSFVNDSEKQIEVHRRESVLEDEITDIENSFEIMTKDIRQYLRDNEELTRREAYTEAELDVARKIQIGFVPKEYSFEEDRLELYGSSQAAKEVGGDFYDVFRLEDGNVAVVIGDISGKGISSAMFMTLVKSVIRENLRMGRGLAETINWVNSEIWASNPEKMFATVFACIIQPETGIVTFANAGHEEPLILGRDPYYMEITSGMPVGLFNAPCTTEEKIVLREGDGILLYTDGITDAINAEKDSYEKDRLRETVLRSFRQHSHSYDTRTLVSEVTASVLTYSEGMEQFDDMTCVALTYKGNGGCSKLISPELTSFDVVKESIFSALGDSEMTRTVILVCEEMFTNILNYSGADQIIFSEKCTKDLYIVTYDDNGSAFNPVNAEILSKEFAELANGGMGILLARSNTRDMIYNRIDGRNVLMMVFDRRSRSSSG